MQDSKKELLEHIARMSRRGPVSVKEMIAQYLVYDDSYDPDLEEEYAADTVFVEQTLAQLITLGWVERIQDTDTLIITVEGRSILSK